jgi:hypothetical protein
MSDILIRASIPGDSHWGYDDPSGVADTPLELTLPATLRGGVEHAAAREGKTPAQWLIALVSRTLFPTTPKAA